MGFYPALASLGKAARHRNRSESPVNPDHRLSSGVRESHAHLGSDPVVGVRRPASLWLLRVGEQHRFGRIVSHASGVEILDLGVHAVAAQSPRHVPDRRKSARQMLLPPGRLAPGACNEHTSKTCEIDNALNPFGSWLLEKRCKLGSTASLASTTSQH